MGILSGLISTATNAVGTNENAQATAAKSNMAAAIERAQLQHQEQQDQIAQAVAQRAEDQAKQKDAITLALHGYIAPHSGTGDGRAIPNEAFGLEDVRPGVQIGTETYDYDPNLDPTHQKLSVQQGIAHDRNQVSTDNNIRSTTTSRANNQNTVGASVGNNLRTTETSRANNANTVAGAMQRQAAKGPSGGAAGAMADVRLQVAGGQIQQADERMTKFEDEVLNKAGSLNPIGVKLARAAIAGSTAAESALNNTYPELASYVRDAKQIATAERLISPRGGSNAMTQAEAMLSSAGASASRQQIENARQYRRSLSHALAGHSGASAPVVHPTTLSPEDAAKAQQDPEFAAWLKAQGHQ